MSKEKTSDLQDRKEKFVKELEALQKKYDLLLATRAFLTQDGRIASMPDLVDGSIIREQQKTQESKLSE